ncbi:MAG: peptidoglycan DD-metalloendopeptidase family protein [Oleiphilaceae bacterium]|nr:peptidoglycan DD-metalloendopeptidase family protein [Oleiphilaceae bacterium]
MTSSLLCLSRPSRVPVPCMPLRRCLSLVWLCLSLLCAPAVMADEEVSRQRLEALQEEIEQVSLWLDKAGKEQDTLLERLRGAERAIGRLNSRLRELEQRRSQLGEELEQLDRQRERLNEQLESQRKSLVAQLRSAWMQGDHSALVLLLNQSDPQKLSRHMTYYEYISRDAVKRLERFQATLAELAENRRQASAARENLNQTRSETARQRDLLASQRKERQQALEALQSRISRRQSELVELESNRERLRTLLEEVEEAVKDIEPPQDTAPFDSLRGTLPWPTGGDLSVRFGEKINRDSDLRHDGIRVAANRGEDVQAVHYGRVIFADWLRGYGLLIILDHGDGYMSLYGSNSSLLYSVGDWVRGGDVIALTGDSGGQSRAGLYFEIRHQGNPQNPMDWLQ